MEAVENPEELELIQRNPDEVVVNVEVNESNSIICRICFDKMTD